MARDDESMIGPVNECQKSVTWLAGWLGPAGKFRNVLGDSEIDSQDCSLKSGFKNRVPFFFFECSIECSGVMRMLMRR